MVKISRNTNYSLLDHKFSSGHELLECLHILDHNFSFGHKLLECLHGQTNYSLLDQKLSAKHKLLECLHDMQGVYHHKLHLYQKETDSLSRRRSHIKSNKTEIHMRDTANLR